MPLDGISTRFLAKELDQALAGSRVDRVNQPRRFDIVIQFRQPGRTDRLLLSANPSEPRAHLIAQATENPAQPPMFCMLLRKHLLGARVLSVETIGCERILILRFQVLNDLGDTVEKRLICEIMGRHSNLILLNEDHRILDAVSHVDASMSRVREVMPARPYSYPPPQTKQDPDELLRQLQQGRSLSERLSTLPTGDRQSLSGWLLSLVGGFSRQLCDEVCLAAGLSPDQPASDLEPTALAHLDRSLLAVLTKATATEPSPHVYYLDASNGVPADFHALDLDHHGYKKPFSTLSGAMDHYYRDRERRGRSEQKRQFLLKAVQKQQAHLSKLMGIYQKDIRSASGYEKLKHKGDLILSNIWMIKDGMDCITVTDFYDPDQGQLKIELNPHRNPSWNAQNYYRRYNKNKAKLENASRFAESAAAETEYLNNLVNLIEHAESPEELTALKDEMKTLDWFRPERGNERDRATGFHARKAARKKGVAPAKGRGSGKLGFRQYRSSDGFTILAGRNNLQNDRLTLKTARKDDLWFHVQKAPGTHVVIRAEGREVPEQTILEAAETAAWFSRGVSARDRDGGAAIPVDFCPVANVKKPSGARPGMVIYNVYNTVRVRPRDPEYLLPQDPPDEGSSS